MFDTKIVITFILAVSIFFSGIYIINTLPPTTSDKQPQPTENQTALTIALYQSQSYTQGNTTYEFRYVSGGQGNILQVTSEGQTTSHAAISGATPNPFNLKVTIHSATENIIVLHITPP
jgi:hypothetical protein